MIGKSFTGKRQRPASGAASAAWESAERTRRTKGETPGSSMKRRTHAPAVAGIMTSRTVFASRFWPSWPSLACRARSSTPSRPTPTSSTARPPRRARTTTPPSTTTRRPHQEPQGSALQTALSRVRVTASAAARDQGPQAAERAGDQGALAEFLHAAEIDPSNEAAQQEIAKCARSRAKARQCPSSGLPEPTAEAEQLDSMGSAGS